MAGASVEGVLPGSSCWVADADFAEHPYVPATVVETESDGSLIVQVSNITSLQRKKPERERPQPHHGSENPPALLLSGDYRSLHLPPPSFVFHF